ncbi:MAG TPA: SURF1 family protein [Anaerolineales bacterium]|nr:SURF1 family protein [Anaerolineales bacterium]
MFLFKIFERKWLIPTLFVVAGSALCIRLGIWQLDRLEQRRAFNQQFESMRAMPVLDLNQELPENISQMEWRNVQVEGDYDYDHQIALRNQYYGSEYGYHLLTPLLFDGQAVLVDRGWVPAEDNSSPGDWRKYDETGSVNLSGQIRLGQTKPAIGGVADALPADGSKLEIWSNADLERIARQMPYPVLPVYIQPEVDENDIVPPIPFQPTIELTEGPHFGYALQWFTFATIMLVGYPFYLRKQETN